RAIKVTPHVAQNDSLTSTGKRRQSAIDGRSTRHEGYGMSQSRRAMIECIFGWGKQHGTMRKTKHRGRARVAADFLLNLIAYNLIRIPARSVGKRSLTHHSVQTRLGKKRKTPCFSSFFSRLLKAKPMYKTAADGLQQAKQFHIAYLLISARRSLTPRV